MSPEVKKTIPKQDSQTKDHSPLKVGDLIQLWRKSQEDKDLLPTFLAELARSAASLTEQDTQRLKNEVEKSGIKVTPE